MVGLRPLSQPSDRAKIFSQTVAFRQHYSALIPIGLPLSCVIQGCER